MFSIFTHVVRNPYVTQIVSLGYLWFTCGLRSEDSAKTLCIEESETAALVFLLMEYWSPMQGRVAFGRQNLCRITAFNSK